MANNQKNTNQIKTFFDFWKKNHKRIILIIIVAIVLFFVSNSWKEYRQEAKAKVTKQIQETNVDFGGKTIIVTAPKNYKKNSSYSTQDSNLPRRYQELNKQGNKAQVISKDVTEVELPLGINGDYYLKYYVTGKMLDTELGDTLFPTTDGSSYNSKGQSSLFLKSLSEGRRTLRWQIEKKTK